VVRMQYGLNGKMINQGCLHLRIESEDAVISCRGWDLSFLADLVFVMEGMSFSGITWFGGTT
jgi:hypothetical protein